eukprot:gene17879-24270_t
MLTAVNEIVPKLSTPERASRLGAAMLTAVNEIVPKLG